MKEKISIIKFGAGDAKSHEIALKIREKVFVEEQKVPKELEVENEEESIHFLLKAGNQSIATARFRLVEGKVKLERFAILYQHRGKGYGHALLRYVLTEARKTKLPIYLNAQVQVVEYYEKSGFEREGPEFEEAGIKHYKMVFNPNKIKETALEKAICRR